MQLQRRRRGAHGSLSRRRLRRQVGGVVRVAARLRRADDRPQPALPLLHRARSRTARDAAGARAAAGLPVHRAHAPGGEGAFNRSLLQAAL